MYDERSSVAGGSRDEPSAAFARTAVGATAFVLLLVAMGGLVRATDSGLACPDWPRCFGMWVPPADFNIWLEHSHRLLAGVGGLVIIGLAVRAWGRYRHRSDLVRPATFAAIVVVVQSGLGALVVLQLLPPTLVAIHLGVAALLFASLALLAVNSYHPPLSGAERGGRDLRLAHKAGAVAATVFAQMVLGSYATGVGAGYVFNAFPIWSADVAVLESSTIREFIHLAHRGLGYVAGAAVVALAVAAVRERRRRLREGSWGHRERWLVTLPAIAVGLVAIQIGLGIANVLTRAATWSTASHLTVASWLWAALVVSLLLARRWPRPRTVEAEPETVTAAPLAVTGGIRA